MKCPDCDGTGMECGDTSCSLNKERTRIHINCIHCYQAKPCPECEGLGGFELVCVDECYPDACALPGADKSIEGCYACKQVKMRPLTEAEIIELVTEYYIGPNTLAELFKDKSKHVLFNLRIVKLRPKKYEI